MKINNHEINLHDFFNPVPVHGSPNGKRMNPVFRWECVLCRTIVQASSRPGHLRFKHPERFGLPPKITTYQHINRQAWIDAYKSDPGHRIDLEVLR